MPDDLYKRDVLVWAEWQADLPRRLAAGERVNDAVDWPNVIEKVRDVDLSELRACQSLLTQALAHCSSCTLGLITRPWRIDVERLLPSSLASIYSFYAAANRFGRSLR